MPLPPISEEKLNATAADYRQRNTDLFVARRRHLSDLAATIGYTGALRGSMVLAACRAWTAPDRDRAWTVQQLSDRVEDITRQIVILNYGLVRDYVMRFARVERDHLDDFEGAGLVGLMKAIDTYDPAQGPFGQWALRPIKREVLRSVRDNDHQALSPGDFERRPEILATKTLLAEELDRDPTVDEVAAVLELNPDQVRRVLEPARLDSIDLPMSDDSAQTLGDTLPDQAASVEETVLTALSVEALEKWGLPVLNARETFVVCRRFGIDGEPESKLSTIGSTLRLSREAVRNIEGKAISKLSHPSCLFHMLRHGRARRPVTTRC